MFPVLSPDLNKSGRGDWNQLLPLPRAGHIMPNCGQQIRLWLYCTASGVKLSVRTSANNLHRKKNILLQGTKTAMTNRRPPVNDCTAAVHTPGPFCNSEQIDPVSEPETGRTVRNTDRLPLAGRPSASSSLSSCERGQSHSFSASCLSVVNVCVQRNKSLHNNNFN